MTPVLVTLLVPIALWSQPASVAGTYRIALCKRLPCSVDDTLRAHMHGYMVLSDTSLRAGELPADVAAAMTVRAPRAGEPNACYGLRLNDLERRTYAGIGGGRLTTWSATGPRGEVTRISLAYTGDAGHTVIADLSGDTFSAVGRSTGAGMASPPADFGDDIVVGQRVGPPDLAPCIARARDQQAISSRGRSQHATAELPRFGDATDWRLADTSQRFVLLLNNTLLDSGLVRPPGNQVFSGGLRGVDELGGLLDMWTIGPSAPMPDAAAYADETAGRIEELRRRGVPASHINVLGIGSGANIALLVAQRVSEPIGIVFVGACAVSGAPESIPGNDMQLLAVNTVDAADRRSCTARFRAPLRGEFFTLPAEARGVTSAGMPESAAPANRPDEWLNMVISWVRSRH